MDMQSSNNASGQAVQRKAGAGVNLADVMELTSVNGRDAPVDPIVEAANAAFTRIESHRKLFRRDWLPFLDGVYHLSLQAWEQAGRPTRLDRRPDWTEDRVQIQFRRLIAALPWAHFFDNRRTLLSAVRQIGGDREDFLEWYDNLSEEVRERTGYPETLWGMFKNEKKKPDPNTDVRDHNNEQGAANTNTTNDNITEQDTEQVNAGGVSAEPADQAGIRTDDDRMAELVAKNERWQDFGLELRNSLDSGESTLKTGLREELDRLLEGAA